jgi:hypothetical protein
MTPDRDVGPGGAVRFAVGSLTGLRSGSWRIWSAKNTPDVYLAPRFAAGVQKISFHQSGSWSHSLLRGEKSAPFVEPGASRRISIWQRPPPGSTPSVFGRRRSGAASGLGA